MDHESIRHYRDEEVAEVVARLAKDPAFWGALAFFYSQEEIVEIKAFLADIETKREFQDRLIYSLLRRVINNSVTELTFSGTDVLQSDVPYFFISNHRDIVLDSALINLGYYEKFNQTLEIAIGSNLLMLPWVRDVVKLNKSFIVYRDLPMNEMLEAANNLSSYVAERNSDGASIWMAQREGRAKDGNDHTHPGLIKMLAYHAGDRGVEYLSNLNIVPVSISYEYDPCALLKLPELRAKQMGEAYVKSQDEDLRSMQTGIVGGKGRVHVHYGQPLNNQIAGIDPSLKANDKFKEVAVMIDREIHRHYHIWESNQEALAFLESGEMPSDEVLQRQLKELSSSDQKIVMGMYANPVINAKTVSVG